MKIGLFGGSFDPIHNGHLSMIEGALKVVDKVIVIPTVRNAFKRGRILNAAPYRYYMTVAAVNKFGDRVEVSDIEFSLPGISYTVNTVRALIEADLKDEIAKGAELYWICGSDILPTFDQWREPDKLMEMVTLLVARRPGEDRTFEDDVVRIEKSFGKKISFFDIKGVEVASSAIRIDQDYKDIPAEAKEFIKVNGLYQKDRILDQVSDEAVQQFLEFAIALYPILGRVRLLHSLNVAISSVKYAVLFGADVDKALIAGVLHDCAKELPDEEQRNLCLAFADRSFDNRKLWHAPAGAYCAWDRYGIKDDEILNAIKFHTTGRKEMTVLDKVVYLSDKIEPARTYDDLREIRKIAETDLDKAVMLSLKAFLIKCKKKNMDPHPFSKEFAKTLGLC